MVKRHGLRYDLAHQRANHLHGLWTMTEAIVTLKGQVKSKNGLRKLQGLRVLCNWVLLRYERTKASFMQRNRAVLKF